MQKQCMLSVLAIFLASGESLATDFPMEQGASPESCVDAMPGRAYQEICIKGYGGKVVILSAKLCQLPSGVWVTNMHWRCDTKKNGK